MNGFDPVYGARPLRRLVQSAIGDQLAKELLAGDVREGDTVRVDLDPAAGGGTGGLIVGRGLSGHRCTERHGPPRSPPERARGGFPATAARVVAIPHLGMRRVYAPRRGLDGWFVIAVIALVLGAALRCS